MHNKRSPLQVQRMPVKAELSGGVLFCCFFIEIESKHSLRTETLQSPWREGPSGAGADYNLHL